MTKLSRTANRRQPGKRSVALTRMFRVAGSVVAPISTVYVRLSRPTTSFGRGTSRISAQRA
jgi:hypothetical protein